MLTRTQIVNAVCDIVGRDRYYAKVNANDGNYPLIDAVAWAAIVAFRIDRTNNSACTILRQAMKLFDKDNRSDFDNLDR